MRHSGPPLRRQRSTDMPSTSGGYRFFKTIAGPDATAYPSESDDPTVYYAVMLENVSFTETVGAQSLTYQETTTKKHIFNLAIEEYLEENSVVLCFTSGGKWYTMDKVTPANATP